MSEKTQQQRLIRSRSSRCAEKVTSMGKPKWVVVKAAPREDYSIELEFADGKRGVYDARPLLEWPIFAPLKDIPYFMLAQVGHGSVIWPGDLDVAPESLYERCVPFDVAASA